MDYDNYTLEVAISFYLKTYHKKRVSR